LEVEKLHHGTPSGIDNTVIAYGQPIYFLRGQPPQTVPVGAPLHLLIADSGAPSSTRKIVGGVRQRWQADPARYDDIFARIAGLVETARQAIEQGDIGALGAAMSQNHRLLQEMGVSTPHLDALTAAACAAGALGAKLSGAGGGGNVVALAGEDMAPAIEQALARAGAVRVIATTVR
jgi:mevalonate kinase